MRLRSTKRRPRSSLRRRSSRTRLIRPEWWRNSNGARLSRPRWIRIAKRTRTTLPRRERWSLSRWTRSRTGTGPRRASLRGRRARPKTLARWLSPFLGSGKPGFRDRVGPLTSCFLIRWHPLRNRERGLRCLRRFRNLPHRTTETRRFSSGFHVYLTWPGKNC